MRALSCVQRASTHKLRKLLQPSNLSLNRAIDDVMTMEGLDNLTDSELSSVLFARGFNPSELTREEQLQHLRDWVDVTTKLDPRSIALYLHLPALLFLNSKINKEIEHVDIPDDE